MRPHYIIGALMIVWLIWASNAQATIVSATALNQNTAPTLNSTFGALNMALNFGGANLTRDTINFTGVTVASLTTPPATVATSPFTVTISTGAGQTLSADNLLGDALFHTEIYSSNNTPMTLLVTGLNASRTYQFQFLHGEPRNGNGLVYTNGTVTFTDSASNSTNLSLTFGSGGGVTTNDFALITVVVSNSTSLSYAMPAAVRGPSYSGMVIQSVPEPSTLAISVLGAVVTLLSARRRC